MKKIIFLLVLFVGYCKSETIAIEQIISMCCSEGEEWGTQREPCSDYKQRLDLVPNELYGLCLSTVEICCSKQQEIYQCTAGQIAAKSGLDCYQKDKKSSHTGIEYYKNCCEACKIGLVVGSSSNKCSLDPFSFGLPWDDAYKSCCGELKSEGIFTLSEADEKDLCNRFERLCDQICENTDESYLCRCNDGYQLLEDKRTCVRIANRQVDVEENEIPTNDSDSNDCPRGFIKTDEEGCIDVDECATTARCDPENQVCFNTEGSYNCLDILPASTSCQDGYRYNYKTENCQDKNECLEELDNCDRLTQHCLNTRGNFTCQDKFVEKCFPGLRYDNVSKTCQDINECEEDTASCDIGYSCYNTIGSFECVKKAVRPLKQQASLKQKPCEYGFHRAGNACIDVDECATDPYACDRYQICTNEIGGFRCDCKNGFILEPTTKACVDVNECQINNHECLESQRCDNTIGSYTCIRLQSCGTGYTLNAETGNCDDDDECVLNRHNCVLPYECRNTRGSFRCLKPRPTVATTKATTPRTTTARRALDRTTKRSSGGSVSERYEQLNLNTNNQIEPRGPDSCTGGLERNSHGACVDINECDRANVCRKHQRCHNSNGSYRCENLLTCSGGFTANEEGTQCVDIDECKTREANCGPDQICRNKAGGYTCMCPPGHIINQNRRCEDINECELYKDQVCPSNAECQNTIGSYRCECKSGFTKQRDEDRVCVDVDECEISNLCHQRCINYWGSYRCACESGYRLNENNRTCDDLNECEVHKTYNLCMGSCDNIPGSYVCGCPSGYQLAEDARTCQDIDECATQNLCNGHHEICTNTRGGYRCKQIECPYGYMLDSDKKNRCKRIAILCDRDDIECFIKPSSYSYNFITITSNMSLPPQGRALFNLRGPNWYENIDFDLKVINVNAPSDVPKADERHFSMNKMQNEVLLNLIKTLHGPQDIELDLSMTVFRDGRPSGSNVAKIFLIVSEHSF